MVENEGDKELGELKEELDRLLDIEEELVEKIFELAAEHSLRIDLEFQDQEVSIGNHNLKLSGKTIIKGEKKEE